MYRLQRDGPSVTLHGAFSIICSESNSDCTRMVARQKEKGGLRSLIVRARRGAAHCGQHRQLPELLRKPRGATRIPQGSQDKRGGRDAAGHALAYVYFEDEPGRARQPT
jgi:hypothetical protein